MYEGALDFLSGAAAAHGREEFGRFAHLLERARTVIAELSSTLDHEQGGELPTMLDRLYEYMMFRLTEAQRTRSLAPVDEVMKQLGQIYDANRQVILGASASVATPGFTTLRHQDTAG
jgi:flagellar protein FliS